MKDDLDGLRLADAPGPAGGLPHRVDAVIRLEPDDRGEVDEVEASLHQPRVADEDIDAHWPCTGWRSVSRRGRT